MMHRNQSLAVMRQVKDTNGSKVVDVQGVAEGVVKVDTRSRVENDLDLFYEYIAGFWGQAETFDDQITIYGNHSFFDDLD